MAKRAEAMAQRTPHALPASGDIPEHSPRRVLGVVVAQERVKLLRIHPLNLLLKLAAVMPIVRIGTRVCSRTG
jgi:hypothetical protein